LETEAFDNNGKKRVDDVELEEVIVFEDNLKSNRNSFP
jgi:hypothetical protein